MFCTLYKLTPNILRSRRAVPSVQPSNNSLSCLPSFIFQFIRTIILFVIFSIYFFKRGNSLTTECVHTDVPTKWRLTLQIDVTQLGRRSSDFAHSINRKQLRSVFIACCHDSPLCKFAMRASASIAWFSLIPDFPVTDWHLWEQPYVVNATIDTGYVLRTRFWDGKQAYVIPAHREMMKHFFGWQTGVIQCRCRGA